jgi:hypothetical protein
MEKRQANTGFPETTARVAGAALLGSIALLLYSTGWALVRLVAGSI